MRFFVRFKYPNNLPKFLDHLPTEESGSTGPPFFAILSAILWCEHYTTAVKGFEAFFAAGSTRCSCGANSNWSTTALFKL